MWRGVLRDGTVVAIKCLRLHLLLEGDIESMKVCILFLYRLHSNLKSRLSVQACSARNLPLVKSIARKRSKTRWHNYVSRTNRDGVCMDG